MQLFTFYSFLIVLLSLCNSLVQAQTCSDLALRTNFSDELSKGTIKYTHKNDQYLGPVRNQHTTSYCYAYAGADLYEHWLKKNRLMDKKDQVSGISLGIMTQKRNWKDLMSDLSGQLFLDREKVEKLEEAKRKLKDSNDQQEAIISKLLTKITDDEKNALYKSLGENIKKNFSLLADLAQLEKSFTQKTSGGGSSKMAIEKSMKNLCFEAEVSSEGVGKLQDENKSNDSIEVHPWDVFRSINDALLYLNLDKKGNEAEFDKENCQYLKVVNAIFPGLSFGNVNELKKFLEKLGESHVDEFINASCSDKKILKKPKIKEEFELSNFVLKKKNKKIERMIEGALEKGDIAVAYYHGNLLSSDKFSRVALDAHTSVITGSLDICGKNYYVLRNSWGKNSCELNQARFDHESSKNKIYTNANQKKGDCLVVAAQKMIDGNKGCNDHDLLCKNKIGDLYLEETEQCRKAVNQMTQNLPLSTLYCSAEGDYIIAKDHFLKGAFGATVIEN